MRETAAADPMVPNSENFHSPAKKKEDDRQQTATLIRERGDPLICPSWPWHP